jgi:hypothetical protein
VTGGALGAAIFACAGLAPSRAVAEPGDRGLQVRAAFWGEWIPQPWAPPSLVAGALGLVGISVHGAWRFPSGFELGLVGVRTAAVVAGEYASATPGETFALARVPSGTLAAEVGGIGFFHRGRAWTLTVRVAPGVLGFHVRGRPGDGATTYATSPAFFTMRGEVEGCAAPLAVRICAFVAPTIVQMDRAGNGMAAGVTVAFGP